MGVKMCWIQIKMGHPLARNEGLRSPHFVLTEHTLIIISLYKSYIKARQ